MGSPHYKWVHLPATSTFRSSSLIFSVLSASALASEAAETASLGRGGGLRLGKNGGELGGKQQTLGNMEKIWGAVGEIVEESIWNMSKIGFRQQRLEVIEGKQVS